MRSISGSNALNKVSSFFEKAMEALGVEEELSPSPIDLELGETFMATFGTQIQTTYMLRLLVSNPEQVFYLAKRSSPEEELAFRAQIMTSMYRKNLSGAIMLLRKDEVLAYMDGKIYPGKIVEMDLTQYDHRSVA